jgi:hypothetical protein
MDKHTLEVMLKFSLDPAAQERIKSGTSTIKDELKKVQDNANATRESMGKISSVGVGFMAGGMAILAPALLAAQKYVNYMGQADDTSRRWIAATKEIDGSTMKIGETVATIVLPYLEQAADVAERFAGFVSQNPEVMRVILSVAGVLAGGGAILATAANVAKQVATIQLVAAKLMGEAADKQVKAGGEMAASGVGKAGAALGKVTVVAASLVIGGEIGLGLGNIINKIIYGADAKDQQWSNILATVERLATISAYGYAQVARLFGLDDVSNAILDVVSTLGKLAEESDAAAAAVDNVVPKVKEIGLINDQSLTGFIDMQKQIVKAQEQYEKERTRIIEEAEKNRVDITKRINDAISKYNATEATERARLGANIARVEANLQRDLERAREAHLERLKNLEEAHDEKILDLRIKRDAAGIKQENKDYKKAVNTENKSYSDETRQKREDARQQIADLRASFNEQRAERRAAFEEQMAELKKESELVATNRDEELKKLSDSYRAQVDMIQTTFIDRLNAMTQTILGNTAAFQELMKRKAREFQDFIDAAMRRSSGSTTGSGGRRYALGGYSYTEGPAYLDANEFVLTDTTTRALEAKTGGQLTQNAIIAGFGNYKGGSGNTYHVTVGGTFNGVSPQTQADITQLIRREVEAGIIETFKDYS